MRVKLTLEYDMGDYSDMVEETFDGDIEAFKEYCKDADNFAESFFQSDVLIVDLDIVGVKLEDV